MSALADRISPALRQLARLHGVHPGYRDMTGQPQHATAASLCAVLRTLGVPIERLSDAPGALRETRRAIVRQGVEPVHVAWRGQRAVVPLQRPEQAAAGAVRCEWRLEDGQMLRTEARWERLPVERVRRVDGESFITRKVSVPSGLPVGYHRLALECSRERFETQVFCAPARCHQAPPNAREWGVFAPLYALHSDDSWGAGDFGDMAAFITWVRRQGGGFAGTLPLLPAFLGKPCEPSPYSPVSRLFWNEFYIDLDDIPEFQNSRAAQRLARSPEFRKPLRKLREMPVVDYAGQMALKRRVLEGLSREFFGKPSLRRAMFEKHLGEQPRLEDYARFRAVHEQRGEPWTRWPARQRHGELREADGRLSVLRYHLYVQWLAHEQMARLSDHARHEGVALYLDMPLGTHRDGYDCWRYQELFALEASGGAPPEPVFTQGQDWGFAPLHPQRSREQGHEYVRAYLRHHLRHARMLRFDHVMGLHRLYWLPRGAPASQGAYVTYPAEEFYAMLSIESHRHRALIIGENLGTVPPEVNRSLRRHGVAGMFVAQYEARPQPRPALRRIPADVVASLNTHDSPTFAAFWQGLDLADRCDLGRIKQASIGHERRLRERIRRSLVRYLRRHGRLAQGKADPGAVFRALVGHLGASKARWVLVNLEDLWLETLPQNTPGTSTKRVNWRRKARLSLEQMGSREVSPGSWMSLPRGQRPDPGEAQKSAP